MLIFCLPCLCRIIPAYAGSTWHGTVSAAPETDHPRIRGEHTGCPSTSCRWKGSSPHTRGAPFAILETQRAGRIIPAYAGSTMLACHDTRSDADHPRIRGEHHTAYTQALMFAGSSPHTRGARAGRG